MESPIIEKIGRDIVSIDLTSNEDGSEVSELNKECKYNFCFCLYFCF
jgi:hypothetical protein